MHLSLITAGRVHRLQFYRNKFSQRTGRIKACEYPINKIAATTDATRQSKLFSPMLAKHDDIQRIAICLRLRAAKPHSRTSNNNVKLATFQIQFSAKSRCVYLFDGAIIGTGLRMVCPKSLNSPMINIVSV